MRLKNVHNFELVAGDTDGLAFRKKDHAPWNPGETEALIDELNSYMEGFIKWEQDGEAPLKTQIVVKAKNYIMQDHKGRVQIKGSALKATTKEKALQRFLKQVIQLLLEDKPECILNAYNCMIIECNSLTDISEWASKKTITKAVLTSSRTNEKVVREALKGKPVQEGDKVYMFFETDSTLCLVENFSGVYDRNRLFAKLYSTLAIFATIINIKDYPNYTLKRNQAALEALLRTATTAA